MGVPGAWRRTMQRIAILFIASLGTMWRIALLCVASPGAMWQTASTPTSRSSRQACLCRFARSRPPRLSARGMMRAARPRWSCHTKPPVVGLKVHRAPHGAVPAQMWAGQARSRCGCGRGGESRRRCGRGGPSSGGDAAGEPKSRWQGSPSPGACDTGEPKSRRRYGIASPSPGADTA
jgi:hypothetical protein